MTVFRRSRAGAKSKVYDYKFMLNGHTYRGSTGQISRDAALAFERKERDRIRQIAFGLAPNLPREGISFMDWAEEFYDVKARSMRRPDALQWHIRAILRFFGRPPSEESGIPVRDDAPYYDLRLTDVVSDPHWLERFEREFLYIHARSVHTRRHWRNTLSQMFEMAASPRFRSRTGVTSNPMAGFAREHAEPRTAQINPETLRRILQWASYHVRLAIAIGILAPKLRLSSILALRWNDNFDETMTTLTVHRHKSARAVGRPQVYPIPEQLRQILQDARGRSTSPFVITYQGRPVKEIRSGLRNACEAAGVLYGIKASDGVTFHTLRHAASSKMAALGVSPLVQRDLMGHASVDMTAWYTHSDDPQLRAVAEQLSGAFPIVDLVTVPRRRAVRSGDKNGDHSPRETAKPQRKAREPARPKIRLVK